ncbi:MAG: SPOR domain-containing protein, partial [Flavobacteriales bacterium]
KFYILDTFMYPVTRHINRLLFEVDCVIVPGLGGFVANYNSALLNRTAGLIEPPSKGLIFNKNLVVNDGLLASAIAQTEQISYAEANLLIEEFVYGARKLLLQGQRIEIPDVGFLYSDNEQNLRFQPVYSVNFLKDSFGLTPVMASAIRETIHTETKKLQPELEEGIVRLEKKQVAEEKVAEKEKKANDSEVIKMPLPPVKRWYWAAAVLLPLAFYSIWIPTKTDALQTGQLQLSDFNPFYQHTPARYEVRPYITDFDTISEKEEVDSLDFSHLTIVHHVSEKEPAESTFVKRNQINPTNADFHVIAGCFLSKENALIQVAILKAQGLNAYLFGMSGQMHRVAVGSFRNKAEAVVHMSQLRASGKPAVWLLTE